MRRSTLESSARPAAPHRHGRRARRHRVVHLRHLRPAHPRIQLSQQRRPRLVHILRILPVLVLHRLQIRRARRVYEVVSHLSIGVGFGVAALALAFPLAPIARESIRRRSNALVAPRARANARDASATSANPRVDPFPASFHRGDATRGGRGRRERARCPRDTPSARRRACAEDMAGPRERSSVDRSVTSGTTANRHP